MADVYDVFADEQMDVRPCGFFFILVQPLVSTSTKLIPVDIVLRYFSKWMEGQTETEAVLAHFILLELNVEECMRVQPLLQTFQPSDDNVTDPF